jgi:hypothetical protein
MKKAAVSGGLFLWYTKMKKPQIMGLFHLALRRREVKRTKVLQELYYIWPTV